VFISSLGKSWTKICCARWFTRVCPRISRRPWCAG